MAKRKGKGKVRVPVEKRCGAVCPYKGRTSTCARRKGHTGFHQSENDHKWDRR